MAFYNADEEEDKKQDEQGGVTTSPETATLQTAGPKPSGGTAPKAASAPDHASNFVGIKQYLDANKAQAQKLGDQAAGVVNQSANQVRQGVTDLQNQANQKIIPTATLGQDVTGKLASGAEALTGDERNLVKNTAAAQYKGPKDVSDFGDYYKNAAKATEVAKQNLANTGTEQGRMNLITQINSKPRTQGMNVFDNTLLQAGGGREKLAQAAQANKDVPGALDTAAQNIRNQIGRYDDPSTPDIDESQGAMGQTAKAQADASKRIQDALTSWQSGFAPKVDQARQQLIDQENKITGDLGNNMYGLDKDTMDMLGLKPGQYSYNLDFNKYLNKPTPDQINAANVADQTDYARYGALADLAGVSPEQMALNPQQAALAGTAPKFGANKEQLAKDLAAAEAASNKKFNVADLNPSFGAILPHVWSGGIGGGMMGYQPNIPLPKTYEEAAQFAKDYNDTPQQGELDKIRQFLSALNKNRNAIKSNT